MIWTCPQFDFGTGTESSEIGERGRKNRKYMKLKEEGKAKVICKYISVPSPPLFPFGTKTLNPTVGLITVTISISEVSN